MSQIVVSQRLIRIKDTLQRFNANMNLAVNYTDEIKDYAHLAFKLIDRVYNCTALDQNIRGYLNGFLNQFDEVFHQLFPNDLPFVRTEVERSLNWVKGSTENLYGLFGSLHAMIQCSLLAPVANPPHQMDLLILDQLEDIVSHFMLNNGVIVVDIIPLQNGN